MRRVIARWRRGSGRVGAQRVAEAANGPNQSVVVAVELAPQVADVRLDNVVVAVEVVLPYMVENLLLESTRSALSSR